MYLTVVFVIMMRCIELKWSMTQMADSLLGFAFIVTIFDVFKLIIDYQVDHQI